MALQINLPASVLIVSGNLFSTANYGYGYGAMKISGFVLTAVDQHGHPVIGGQIGKFAGGPRGNEINMLQIFRNRKSNQTGIGLAILMRRQDSQALRCEEFFQSLANYISSVQNLFLPGADQRQLLVNLEKYEKPCIIRIVDVLPSF